MMQVGDIEYLKPNEKIDIGNSVYFKPNDEPKNLDEFRHELEDIDLSKSHRVQPHHKAELPQIDEASNDDEDEELQCMEFGGDIGHEDAYLLGGSASMSPRRSLTDLVSLDSSVYDSDYIDIGNVTEEHIEVGDARRYFKHRWWLINPDRWPKRYWDNFVGIIIVAYGHSRSTWS